MRHINFNRYFYRYAPPRPPEAIEADSRSCHHLEFRYT
jgi:hypothetical protein